MIVVCPECTKPFEIPAAHVAPLVQIACPHCQFRMILDIAAANDPNLAAAASREGAGTTSGYLSKDDYQSAVAGDLSADGATASSTPIEAVKEAPSKKPGLAADSIGAPPPRAASPVAKTPVPEPVARPAATVGDQSPAAQRSIKRTMIGVSMPPIQEAPPDSMDAPAKAAPKEQEHEEDLSVDVEVDEVELSIETDSPRTPPHTPPPHAATSTAPPESGPVPAATSPAEISHDQAVLDESFEEDFSPKSSFLSTFLWTLIVLLLLAGASVVAYAYQTTGDPNPVPILESLLEELKQRI